MNPKLTAGRVYRTKDFARWTANPARLAKRLVRQGDLRPLARGLFVRAERSKFGETPPSDEALMRGFLENSPFVFTGPDQWNALGLGTTALFAVPLVYNTKRSGQLELGGRPYLLRRVKFPAKPTAEWFAVDLLENRVRVGATADSLRDGLAKALKARRLNGDRLRDMAAEFGTEKTRQIVKSALRSSAQ